MTIYFKQNKSGLFVVSIYVDDLLIIGDEEIEIQKLNDGLMKDFKMTDLGSIFLRH